MKLVLAGSTGLVGYEVLLQCLAHPRITSVVTLTRRELPSSLPQSEKPKSMIVSYFTNYSEEVMRELQSAEACIWSLGRPASAATARVVDLGYTTHAAKIFASHAAATNSPFRFVYASGALAERDQDKGLWFMGEARRVRGEVENQLLDLQERSPGFETAIVRPWAVGAKGAGLLYAILGALDKGIRVDELARVMVDVAVSGGRTGIIENHECRTRASKIAT